MLEKTLHERYDSCLGHLFYLWLDAMQQREAADLLADAECTIDRLNGFWHVATLPDAEKADRMKAVNFEISAPFCGCADYNPDYAELREAVNDVCAGIYDRAKYPDHPDVFDGEGMAPHEIRACLLEKVLNEYEDCVLGVFLEMDKTDLLFRSENYVRLCLFYEELRDCLSELGMDRESLLRMMNLDNTLNTVLGECEGCGIEEYIERNPYDDLVQFYMPTSPSAPQYDLRL